MSKPIFVALDKQMKKGSNALDSFPKSDSGDSFIEREKR
jgi:hypothetical protein